jgi:hypothetical protein
MIDSTSGAAAFLSSLVFLCLCSLSFAAPAPTKDRFGVAQLAPTVAGGREWVARWDAERVVSAYAADPADPLFYNEEGELRIGNGIAAARAGLTRLVVLSPASQAGTTAARLWTNVEMTVYARRGVSARWLDY